MKFILVCLALTLAVASAQNIFCRGGKYCQNEITKQYFCCDNLPATQRFCPPVRPHCPPTKTIFPRSCKYDTDCDGGIYEKCCFDTCLQDKVCKVSLLENLGQFGTAGVLG